MGDFTQTLYDAVQYFLGFGPTVMLPIMLFLVGLIFKTPPAQALKSALLVGIGFVGVYAIFSILTENIAGAANAMVERIGVDLSIVDLGWPPLAAITWGGPIAPFVIPLTLLINLGLISLRWTKTLDVDIWNYWHFALAGTLVYYATGNFFLGLLAAAIAAVVILKIADWSAPMVSKTFGLEGISLPTLSSATFFPVGLFFNWVIDRIPGLRNITIKPETIQRRLGVFGEPLMIGTILGVLLGIAAGYDVQGVLTLGINLGAVMFILPKMVAILMEGLLPLSSSIKGWLSKRFPDRPDLYIGLDIAVAVGESAVIATGLLLVPISLVLAFIIPGNGVLPLGDLANLAVFASMIVLACRANVFRALLISIPILIGNLLIATAIAPVITSMATAVKFDLSGASQVSGFLDGGNPFRFWLVQIFSGQWVALGLIPVVGLLVWFTYKKTKTEVYAGEAEDVVVHS